MTRKAGRVPEGTAIRIADLRPDDPRLPRAKAVHMVFCRISGWTHGKFRPWDDLDDHEKEWWIAQWLFVMGL